MAQLSTHVEIPPGNSHPQMMSLLPRVFVYIASFPSANEHPLAPHGCVVPTSFWGPIMPEPHRPHVHMHCAATSFLFGISHKQHHSLSSPKDIQPYHASINQPQPKDASDSPRQTPRFHRIQLE